MTTERDDLPYSEAAYNPREHLEKWTCKACVDTKMTPEDLAVVDISSEDGRFYVAHINDDDGHHKLVVTFRGTVTESSTNWVTNLDAFYQEAKFGGAKYIKGQFGGGHHRNSTSSSRVMEATHANMHRGFYKLYEMMSDDVLTTMAELAVHEPKGVNTEVIVVGHSLAGGVGRPYIPSCRFVSPRAILSRPFVFVRSHSLDLIREIFCHGRRRRRRRRG